MAPTRRILGISRVPGGPLDYLKGGVRGGGSPGMRGPAPPVTPSTARRQAERSPDVGNGPSAAVLNIFPWWQYQYESAANFMQHDFFIAVAALSTTPAGVEFTIPSGRRGILKQFLVAINNSTALTNVSLRLLRSGKPIQGFDDVPLLTAPVTYQALPYNDVNLRFEQNEKISAEFINRNATPWTMGLQISGWHVSASDIARLQGGLAY